MLDRSLKREIVEEFTFRANGRVCYEPRAVIDTGAMRTIITERVVRELSLWPSFEETMYMADGSPVTCVGYRCVVAWTIYEDQGYFSEMDVVCAPGAQEVLIGLDFLSRHELKVDTKHGGLVGTAPDNAVPLLGGGYGVNAPEWYVRKLNRERFQAAPPGKILRPHPAWRFKLPHGFKTK